MKKFALITTIFFLVLSTAIIKNTTKQIEDEIFTVKENIRVLKSEFENVSLEHDYLSSADKLLEYQSLYFENDSANSEHPLLILTLPFINFSKKGESICKISFASSTDEQ